MNVTGAFDIDPSACTRVGEMIDTVRTLELAPEGPLAAILPAGVLLTSLLLLGVGARLVRVAAALSGGIASFCLVYAAPFTLSWECSTRLLVSAGVAFLAAVICTLLVKVALFLLGAATVAGLVHVTYLVFPELHELGQQPRYAQLSLSYWICMVAAVVTGGLVVRFHSHSVLEILTSAIGGIGLSYALYSFSLLAGLRLSLWVVAAAGLLGFAVGVYVQRRYRLRGELCCTRPTARTMASRESSVREASAR